MPPGRSGNPKRSRTDRRGEVGEGTVRDERDAQNDLQGHTAPVAVWERAGCRERRLYRSRRASTTTSARLYCRLVRPQVWIRNPQRGRSRVPRNNPVNLHAATTTHFLHGRSDAATTRTTTTHNLRPGPTQAQKRFIKKFRGSGCGGCKWLGAISNGSEPLEMAQSHL